MADNEKLVNEFLDSLAELVIENSALRAVLDDLARDIPIGLHRRLLFEVEALKSDPVLRETVAGRFYQFRNQAIADILPELLKKFPKITR